MNVYSFTLNIPLKAGNYKEGDYAVYVVKTVNADGTASYGNWKVSFKSI